MKKYYTIPVFIPEKACPFRCTYCNQYNIVEKDSMPSFNEIKIIIEKYLKTFPKDAIKKVGFFGGNFTGMSLQEQSSFLEIVSPYIDSGDIQSIMLSTRPDYISEEILDNLKKFNVEIIELGAQSLDDEVLFLSNRGHKAVDVEEASNLIIKKGFSLGLQMMIGLPGDTIEKSINTANKIINLGAKFTRIYPTLIIKNTDLEIMYNNGKYTPLSLKEAVNRCKVLYKLFEKHNVCILRMGLHPSEGLINGKNLIDGPFHISFKELVMTEIWKDILLSETEKCSKKNIIIEVASKHINYAVGYNSTNKKELLKSFQHVVFKTNDQLINYTINITS